MIRDLKTFYVAIYNNEVVCFETNLSKFIESFKKMENGVKSYQYYNKEFKNNSFVTYANKERKVYFLQKLF
jgi:hypothetical protein